LAGGDASNYGAGSGCHWLAAEDESLHNKKQADIDSS
jgi:hypothetical protein